MPADVRNTDSIVTNQAAEVSIENQYISYGQGHGKKTISLCTLPGRSAYCDLIGRQDVIEKLTNGFERCSRQIIAGASGIGKSHIALTFARAIHKPTSQLSYSVDHIFMVSIDTIANFCAGYEKIASAVGITSPPRSHRSYVLSRVYDWLNGEESGSWLLLLDNVYYKTLYQSPYPPPYLSPPQHPDQTLRALLPDADRKRRHLILTTTHDRVVADLYREETCTVDVPDLSVYGACQLLDSRLSERQRTDERVPTLVKELDCNSLVITSTSKYILRIRDTENPLENCLKSIQYEGIRGFLARQRKLLTERTAVEPLRYSLSLDHILQRVWDIQQEAIHVFGFLSCFEECCITLDMVKACPRWKGHQLDIDEHVSTLQNNYLVSNCELHCGLKIQKLVRITSESWFQTLSSTDNSYGGEDYQDIWQYEALRALFALSRNLESGNGEPSNRFIISHLGSFSRYLGRRKKPIGRLSKELAETLVKFAGTSTEAGEYEQSQIVLHHVAQGYGVRDHWRATALLDLAESIRSRTSSEREKQKRLKEACSLLWEAQKIAEELKDNRLKINICSTHSLIYCDRGNFEKAIKLQFEARDLSRSAFGEGIEYLDALTIMGRVYSRGGYLKEAIEHLDRVLNLLEGLGNVVADEKEKRYRLHAAEGCLARVYHVMKNSGEACKYGRRAYEGRRQLLGENKIKTLSTGMELAYYLDEHGSVEEAERLSQEILRVGREVYGRENEEVREWEKMIEMIDVSKRFSKLSLSR